MTNTKFRRRALVSSLAMLLVALVALGSATFAWFTDNPVADATGVTGKGQTSQGLVIYTDTEANPVDPHSAHFFNNVTPSFTMQPAYDAGSHNFLTAPATTSGASGINTAKTWSAANVLEHVSGTGVYKESAYLKTTGAGSTATNIYLTGVAATFGSSTMKEAACVAVYVGTTHIVTYKNDSTGPITYTSPSAGANPVVGSGNDTVQAFGANSYVATALGTATDSNALEVTFYVYLDGSDDKVYTDAATADEIISSITANFSTVNPAPAGP